MPLTAVQIAVACGWICLLNVLTILALKALNRESYAITHVVSLKLPRLLLSMTVMCFQICRYPGFQ